MQSSEQVYVCVCWMESVILEVETAVWVSYFRTYFVFHVALHWTQSPTMLMTNLKLVSRSNAY